MRHLIEQFQKAPQRGHAERQSDAPHHRLDLRRLLYFVGLLAHVDSDNEDRAQQRQRRQQRQQKGGCPGGWVVLEDPGSAEHRHHVDKHRGKESLVIPGAGRPHLAHRHWKATLSV
jgi:hypothetical protein